MGLIKSIVGWFLLTTTLLLVFGVFALHWLYQPVSTGTLYLKNANGDAEIMRETDTSIPHVYASSEKMALYSQGFIHA